MLKPSELRSTVTCKMGIFIVAVNHTVENTAVFLITKPIYRVPSKIPTKIPESFSASSWTLQTTAEPVP